jgi:hypothetical protein
MQAHEKFYKISLVFMKTFLEMFMNTKRLFRTVSLNLFNLIYFMTFFIFKLWLEIILKIILKNIM